MKKVLSIFAIVAALFTLACSGPATPSDAAVKVYQLIADGKYDVAAEEFYYEGEAEQVAQQKSMITSLFTEKAGPQIESKGGIAEMEAIAETLSEDGKEATVEVKLTYGNGKVENNKLNMVLTDDGWKAAVKK